MDDADFRGQGFGRSRKLGLPDLQLLILGLLAEKPRHGYEVMKSLEARSKGFYTPSPGMVYPALSNLNEVGHATVVPDGSRKRYFITTAGLVHFDQNRTAVDGLFAQFAKIGERMEKVRRAFFADEDIGASATNATDEFAGEPIPPVGSESLVNARRSLETAVARAFQGTVQEQQRVTDILTSATAAILDQTAAS